MTRSPGNRSGLSLVEVLIAAFIVGVSAIPVLELVRSGTSQLEISEIEVAARQVGADLLERVAGPGLGEDKGLTPAFKLRLAQPVSWGQVLDADASLAKKFPRKSSLTDLLDKHDARVHLTVHEPYDHPVAGAARKLAAYVVTVTWTGTGDAARKVTFARLVDLR